MSALDDARLRAVLEADDDSARMIKLFDGRYASNGIVSRIAVQTQLFCMRYSGQNMSGYIDRYTSLYPQFKRIGKNSAIPESHKAPILLASTDLTCSLRPTVAALRRKDISDPS